MEKKAFWEGFIKVALQQTRGSEDVATAATSLIPWGTTVHTLAKDEKGKDGGKEWLARLGGGWLGWEAGKNLGYTGKANVRPFHGKPYNKRRSLIGSLLGMAAGEVLANRMSHSGKYDKSGKLKKEYGGRHDDEKKDETNPAMGY